jgi:hypothetical protein
MLVGASTALVGRAVTVVGPIVSATVELRVGVSVAAVGLRVLEVTGPLVGVFVGVSLLSELPNTGLAVGLSSTGVVAKTGLAVGLSPSLEGAASEAGLDVGVLVRIPNVGLRAGRSASPKRGLAEGLSETVSISKLAKLLAVLVLPDLFWTSTTATEVAVVTVAITAAAIASFTTTVSPVVTAAAAIVLAPAAAEAPATEAA